jgi:hypothetical protein
MRFVIAAYTSLVLLNYTAIQVTELFIVSQTAVKELVSLVQSLSIKKKNLVACCGLPSSALCRASAETQSPL